jgi:hypothetical protein
VRPGAASFTRLCSSCRSANRQEFAAEMFIHPSSSDLNAPTVLVFPRLSVCMNCGLTELTISGPELKALSDRSGKKKKSKSDKDSSKS